MEITCAGETCIFLPLLKQGISMHKRLMTKIKPCPFCGGKAEIEMDESWYWNYHIFCPDCKIGTDYYETADEAKQVWNKRVGEQDD